MTGAIKLCLRRGWAGGSCTGPEVQTSPAIHNRPDTDDNIASVAKLLGGCSSSNAMMFHCGAPEDYDEWAQQAGPGGEEWSYKYFKKYVLSD